MRSARRILFVLATLASVQVFASGGIHISCDGEGVSVNGNLMKTNSGKYQGTLDASGYKVPVAVTGEHFYTGTYAYAPAGQYYKSFDYQIVTFSTREKSITLYGKSYVNMNGQTIDAIYINARPVAASCNFIVSKE